MAKKITLKDKNGVVLCPHTAIEQVQGLKEALDNKLGKTEKAVSAKTTKVSKSSEADPNFALSFYAGQAAPSTTPTADKVYVGSSVDGSIISVPKLDGSTSMSNYMNLRMSFNSRFFHEIAVLPNNNGIYHRNVRNGNALEWKQLLEGLVTTSHIADAAITPAKIQTSIALNGTPSMTVEPTTSSPDKTIASVGLVKEAVDGIEIGGTNLIPVSDFEIGGINNYGVTEFYDNRVRSKNYIQISSRKISAKSWVSGKYKINLYFYNSNKTFIKHTFADKGWFEECQAYAVPEGTAFIKVVIMHSDNSTFVGTDLSSIKIKVENGDKITDWSPAPEDVVNGIKIDTRNLIPNSASIYTKVHATSNSFSKQILLPIGTKVGDTFVFNCDGIVNNQGSATEYSLLLFDWASQRSASNYLTLTAENRMGTFTVTRDVAAGSLYIFLYAGKNNSTAGNAVTYTNCTLVKGNKPMLLWQPAPEDINTEISNAETRSKAHAEDYTNAEIDKIENGQTVAQKANSLYDADSNKYKNWGEIDTAITRKIGNKFEDYATKSYVQGEISKQVAVPIASETEYGKVELATPEDVTAVENDISAVNDSAKAVTPYTLKEYIASKNFATDSDISSAVTAAKPAIFFQAAQPAGGKDGDIWIKP